MVYNIIWFFFLTFPPDQYKSVTETVNYYSAMIIPLAMVVAFICLCISYYMGGTFLLVQAWVNEVDLPSKPEISSLMEKVASAAGVPTPRLFTIRSHTLNSFSIGRNPKNSAIVLTEGMFIRLDRDELEAVIAHEMAHIVTGNTCLNTLAATGVALLSSMGYILLSTEVDHLNPYFHYSERSFHERFDPRNKIFGYFLTVLGSFFAPLVIFALPIRKEFTADAIAAHITKNPEALASALKKIKGESLVKVLRDNPIVSTLCIEKTSPETFLYGAFATHPPIEDRIKALRGG